MGGKGGHEIGTNGYEWLRVVMGGYGWLRMVTNGYELFGFRWGTDGDGMEMMEMNGNEWKWMEMDGNGWKWMEMPEPAHFGAAAFRRISIRDRSHP
jgi:hypothetical protein